MKILSCFLILISQTLFCTAQKYQLAIGNNSISTLKAQINQSNNSSQQSKSIAIDPFLGFHTLISSKSDLWLGVDIGKFKSSSKVSQVSNSSINQSVSTSENKVQVNQTFFSLHLNQNYNYQNLRIGLGLSLPVTYLKREDNQYTYTIFNGQTSINDESHGYKRWPQILQYGVNFIQSVNRKIYKNLYLGIYLNEAFELETRFGKGRDRSSQIYQGVETVFFDITSNYEKYTQTRFYIFPSIKLNYYIKSFRLKNKI